MDSLGNSISYIYLVFLMLNQTYVLKVYVLDDNKQLVMIMGMKPLEIETELDNITRWAFVNKYVHVINMDGMKINFFIFHSLLFSALQNVTGLNIKVRKIEPHLEKNLVDTSS